MSRWLVRCRTCGPLASPLDADQAVELIVRHRKERPGHKAGKHQVAAAAGHREERW